MIIVRLIGGLGNQLFQYAVGRSLAVKHKKTLKVDISGFDTYKLHGYSLPHFNIQEDIATDDEVRTLTHSQSGSSNGFFTKLFRRPEKPLPTHIHEKYFHFDPEILKLADKVYLDGYWQSEKYFIAIEGVVRKEIIVNKPQLAKDHELAKIIQDSNSVSLHIRRGDYVSDATTQQIFGTCSLDYYQRSINRIVQTVSKPHFFIFSDDPEWACNNLKIDYPATIVDHNDAEKNYEDLRLMSQCKHNIIANSSFAWWGAWLNCNPDKIVVAPKNWFQTDKYDPKDLIPNSWEKL